MTSASSTARIAVIGDVHGNAAALRATLLTAERAGFDHLVFMGDLLNYGVDTREVVDLVASCQATHAAPILRGNHDDLVLDLLSTPADTGYYATLPAWIRESVDLTIEQLDATAFRALSFVPRTEVAGFFFAHANPFGERNYRYLNSHDDHLEAAKALREQGHEAGVFGHTHRVRAFADRTGGGAFLPLTAGVSARLEEDSVWVLNAGSIGQPREAPPVCRFLLLTTGRGVRAVECLDVVWDRAAHVAALEAAPLSTTTKNRLVAFF